ncbi:MAG: class I tRNA ligase family protein, partial [Candidatus Omnitrophota bacterium]
TSGRIRFYPARWKKVYLNWMRNLRGWCISRQIWWGHRIPAWYCADCQNTYKQTQKEKILLSEKVDLAEAGIMISRENPQFCPRCGNTNIQQDEDVLDTWFSSWLWPFATFGWPELDKKQEKELAYFYPADTLVTAQEIIFFWVARMIMAGMYFLKEVPFRNVYIHGTVRDKSGTKMSKSLGNIIDPLEIIEQYGCDALRFSIISLTAAGQDVFLSPQKFESGRNFANKVWNAARFIIMNLNKEKISNVDLGAFAPEITELKDKWIISRFYAALENTSRSLNNFRFNDAAKYIYEFFWHEFCDWYIELSKKTITDPATQVVLYKMLEKTLRILHPIMPFITEEIWQNLPRKEGKSIMLCPWPHMQKQFINKKAEKQMQLIISCITVIRNIRSVWQIDASQEISVSIRVNKKPIEKLLNEHNSYIKHLARAATLNIGQKIERPKASAVVIMTDMEIFVPLEGVIDIKKQAEKLTEHLKNLQNTLQNTKKKLGDKEFLSKAPQEIVEAEREKEKQLQESIEKLQDNLKGLE